MFTQSGYRNRYGHPDPGVVDRYAARGLALARTAHGVPLQWRFGADGGAEHTVARATAVRYWHNRPFAGQERPPTGTPDGNRFEEAPREPLSGMPSRSGLVYILLDWFGSSPERAGTTTRKLQAAG
jgi:hypothetical protein